jgi:hypothetical protein
MGTALQNGGKSDTVPEYPGVVATRNARFTAAVAFPPPGR